MYTSFLQIQLLKKEPDAYIEVSYGRKKSTATFILQFHPTGYIENYTAIDYQCLMQQTNFKMNILNDCIFLASIVEVFFSLFGALKRWI